MKTGNITCTIHEALRTLPASDDAECRRVANFMRSILDAAALHSDIRVLAFSCPGDTEATMAKHVKENAEKFDKDKADAFLTSPFAKKAQATLLVDGQAIRIAASPNDDVSGTKWQAVCQGHDFPIPADAEANWLACLRDIARKAMAAAPTN